MPSEPSLDAIKQKIQKTADEIDYTKMWKSMALFLFGLIVITQLFEITITPKVNLFAVGPKTQNSSQARVVSTGAGTFTVREDVLPESGVVLPISWDDLGRKMIADGVIDEEKFRALFEDGLSPEEEAMLSGLVDKPIVMNQENSRFMLDILWAFGLANKNDILENGEMTDEQYGGDASKFASTGGWTLAKGEGFDHYSQHAYLHLTSDQQALVDDVSRHIFRPCCGNSTHFPDCNHGMAMLGLLQLMAANGVSEQEMYDVALKVNSLWFPQTYLDLATYFEEQGVSWDQVDAKTVLGVEYSSAKGYQQTRQQIKSLPKPQQGGGGCGV